MCYVEKAVVVGGRVLPSGTAVYVRDDTVGGKKTRILQAALPRTSPGGGYGRSYNLDAKAFGRAVAKAGRDSISPGNRFPGPRNVTSPDQVSLSHRQHPWAVDLPRLFGLPDPTASAKELPRGALERISRVMAGEPRLTDGGLMESHQGGVDRMFSTSYQHGTLVVSQAGHEFKALHFKHAGGVHAQHSYKVGRTNGSALRQLVKALGYDVLRGDEVALNLFRGDRGEMELTVAVSPTEIEKADKYRVISGGRHTRLVKIEGEGR